MGQFLQITIARKPIQFLAIANCRNGSLSANYDRKKETRLFLKKTYTIFPDRKLQKWVSFCKLRLQEKLDHFSRKTAEFLAITNCRNEPLSANYDRKKNFTISQEKLYHFSRKTLPFLKKNYTISRDHELQKWATFCKLRSQEKLDHFARKTTQFLVITNCRNGPLSANYDCKKN